MNASQPRDTASIRSVLERPFEDSEVFTRKGGGGREFAYITGSTVIRRIMEATDEWSWEITETRVVDTYRNEYTDRDGVVHGGKSDPTPTLVVFGKLTIPGLGSRAGMGVTTIDPGNGEDNLKDAETDALKRAAVKFGVFLDAYDGAYDHLTGQQRSHGSANGSHPVSSGYAGGNRPAPSPTPASSGQMAANGGNPATQGQIRAIFAIGIKRGLNVRNWIQETYGKPIDQLTFEEASAQIDHWNNGGEGAPGKAEAPQGGASQPTNDELEWLRKINAATTPAELEGVYMDALAAGVADRPILDAAFTHRDSELLDEVQFRPIGRD